MEKLNITNIAKEDYMELKPKQAVAFLVNQYENASNDIKELIRFENENIKEIISLYNDNLELIKSRINDENISLEEQEKYYDEYVKVRESSQQVLLDRNLKISKIVDTDSFVKKVIVGSACFIVCLTVVGKVSKEIIQALKR